MIIRARPKYLDQEFFREINTSKNFTVDYNNELFFNAGRSALKFLFDEYKSFYKKNNLIVAMQSFNCEAVIEAALQADIKIILLDINLNDFSIRYDDIVDLSPKPDFLLLTHYQGIPNTNYKKIADFCNENEIFLIDDLALCVNSFTNGIKLGSLSDFQINSFAFDKPFTCFSGGSLSFSKNANIRFLKHLTSQYKKLKYESNKKSEVDLRLLDFIYSYSTKQKYVKNLNRYSYIRKLIQINIPKNLLYHIIKMKGFSFYAKAFNVIKKRLSLNRKKITVLKLHINKIFLLDLQKSKYIFDYSEIRALEKFLKKLNIDIPERKGSIIDWNRYSILDDSKILTTHLKKAGVEAGNYAWPNPLHKLYRTNPNIIFKESYKNSEYASKYIVNIPVWSDFFRSLTE